MRKVHLECKGRLANQILCWANARHVLETFGLTDFRIVVNYKDLSDMLTLPGAEFGEPSAGMPRVRREQLSNLKGDCVWVWEDVFSQFPNREVMARIIRTMEPHAKLHAMSLALWAGKPIGVHIRYGDYEKIDRTNLPAVLPPFIRDSEEYYVNAMNLCRQRFSDASFFIASDGIPDELAFVTKEPDVTWCNSNPPIVDLYSLSRCKVIIGSRSTFSEVAAIYGNIPLITSGMTQEGMLSIINAI